MFHEKQEHKKNVLRLETFKKQKKTFSLIKTLLIISKGKGKQIVAQIIQSRLG